MFISSDTLSMLANVCNDMFANVPKEARFYFAWYKAAITPGGKTYGSTPIFDAVPGLKTPYVDSQEITTPEGRTTKSGDYIILIPKRWGETVAVNGITYIDGVTYGDKLVSMDGSQWKVVGKTSRGYGAYYKVELKSITGLDTDFIKGQFTQ